jgi:hypothetical protein
MSKTEKSVAYSWKAKEDENDISGELTLMSQNGVLTLNLESFGIAVELVGFIKQERQANRWDVMREVVRHIEGME